MKIKILMFGLAGLLAVQPVFAQKGELSNARDQFSKYNLIYTQKALATAATAALNEAKTSIDKASANEKTATLPETYTIKGGVYAELASRDAEPIASPYFATAEEALKKAKEFDKKDEDASIIDNAYRTLLAIRYNAGVSAFKAGKYESAYQDFNAYLTVRPDDTTALYLTGLSATNAKMYDQALSNYNKLITINYSKNADVYTDLSFIYLAKKDSAAALKILKEGTTKYPKDANLSKGMIGLSLQMHDIKGLAEKLEADIAADPRNKLYYYYAGQLYTSLKNYDKAAEAYKKAIEIDPNYFDAYLNLGSVLLHPAIELYNAAQNLPANKQKEYDDDVKKAMTYFEIAKPALLKAAELRPTSYEALFNLKKYYVAKSDNLNANAIQKKMESLK